MNRGRGRQTIFHNENYYQAFLSVLQESHEQFDAVFHGYCLMGNHYHLLVETPKANLSRIMRHINGVYTQRYNRLRRTDGPLFRGRYKSILVDEDAYLLQLSRYIHRNPIDMKRPLATALSDYRWSSYPAYINLSEKPSWLCRDKIYQMLGHRQKYASYRDYVAKGVDEDILRFYNRGNYLPVLGDNEFKEAIRQEVKTLDLEQLQSALADRPSGTRIVEWVAEIFKVARDEITDCPTGRRQPNPARAFAMYACQHYGAMTLKQIAVLYNLSHTGSASSSVNKVKRELADGKWQREIKRLEKRLYIVK